MSSNTRLGWLAILIVLGAARIASAHTGHSVQDFSTGAVHPLSGLDHLLAMVAVGLWSSQSDSKRVWLLPAVFVGGMTLGLLIGVFGLPMPGVELGIAGSVVGFGLLLAIGRKVPVSAAIALTLLFALFHGHAHGAEMPSTSNALSFGVGMLFATALLHAAGVATGLALRSPQGLTLLRVAGGAIACCGLLLATGVL